MDIIVNNPYRILGLPITASDREFSKRVSDFDAYISIGKEPKKLNTDIGWIGPLLRSKETISSAYQKLENVQSRIIFSLFCFLEIDKLDGEAMNCLYLGNIEKGRKVWQNSADENYITANNYQYIKNLCLLSLMTSSANSKKFGNKDYFLSIELMNKLFESDIFWDEYLLLFPKINLSRRKRSDLIINEYCDMMISHLEIYIDRTNGISGKEVINALDEYVLPEIYRQKLLSKLTSNRLVNIERVLEDYQEKINNYKDNAYVLADKIILEIKDDMAYLENIFGDNELSLTILSDNISKYLIRCINRSFNNNVSKDEKLFEICENIFIYANSLKCSQNSKENIQESENAILEIKNNMVCWFCGKNVAVEKCVMDVGMYKVISRDTFLNRTTTRYQTLKVNIRRCINCFDFHKKLFHYKLMFILIFVNIGLLFEVILNGVGIIGALIGLVIGLFSGYIFEDRKYKIAKVKAKSNNSIMKNNTISDLLREGWSIGSSPG
ncbi:MAG: hypothetical protein NTV87_15915 [Ignavibacteriae bacterium]|nr:hypothetical protein [Ignavibacteriota bacterium]